MKAVFLEQLSARERRFLKTLKSTARIQDWLNSIPFNFEEAGQTNYSPRLVLQKQKAHCLEGALFAAAVLNSLGHRPLLLDLVASGDDDDHVVAPFQIDGYWGAISKTNHAVLRYREPVYRSVRELSMSYFHEYFLQSNGRKTLRSYALVNLSRFDKRGWRTAEENLDFLVDYLWSTPHTDLLTPGQIRRLRRAEPIEIQAGAIVQWPRNQK